MNITLYWRKLETSGSAARAIFLLAYIQSDLFLQPVESSWPLEDAGLRHFTKLLLWTYFLSDLIFKILLIFLLYTAPYPSIIAKVFYNHSLFLLLLPLFCTSPTKQPYPLQREIVVIF